MATEVEALDKVDHAVSVLGVLQRVSHVLWKLVAVLGIFFEGKSVLKTHLLSKVNVSWKKTCLVGERNGKTS